MDCVFCKTHIEPTPGAPRGSFRAMARDIGMCDDCYSDLLNIPKPEEEKEWGPVIRKCRLCRTPLYEKDMAKKRCPICDVRIGDNLDSDISSSIAYA